MLTFEEIIGKIKAASNLSRDDILARIRELQDDLHGFITDVGAASVVAHNLGVALEVDPASAKLVPGSIAETIYAVLVEIAPKWDGAIPIEEAKKAAEGRGIFPHTFDSFLERELKRGKIYEPVFGKIALTGYRPSRSTKNETGRDGMDDHFANVKKRLDEQSIRGEKWAPNAGDELIGTIVRTDSPIVGRNEGGEEKRNDLLVIKDSNSKLWTVWKSKALEELFKQVKLGDVVGLKYIGKGKTKGGQSFKAIEYVLESAAAQPAV